MDLNASGIEGADMVPWGRWVHVAHEDLRRLPGLRNDQEGGEADATGRNVGDAERRGVPCLAETRESTIRRHGVPDARMVSAEFQDLRVPVPTPGARLTLRNTRRRTAPAADPSACGSPGLPGAERGGPSLLGALPRPGGPSGPSPSPPRGARGSSPRCTPP